MNNEERLLNDRQLRDQNIERFEILEKVKELLLIPGTSVASVQQVADFYEVGVEAIKTIIARHKDELEEDGISLMSYQNFSKFHNATLKEKCKGKAIFVFSTGQEFEVATRGIRIFPRRAILRVGMLLRDSTVAKEVRTQLLNIEKKSTAETKISDIEEEDALMKSVGRAMSNGDVDELANASAKLMAFKNRHIQELEIEKVKLESTNKALANGILKWEDRSRLNYAVRKLAGITNTQFGIMWNKLYKQLKYKFHIDLKARKGKNLLDKVREDEWDCVMKSFSALCKLYDKEPADMFNDLEIAG